MVTGIIFDLREFTLHDGPGIRTTVFLKGCPLRCAWCHNPEGLSPEPQILHTPSGDRLAGKVYTPDQLAALLNAQAAVLTAAEGGVTFSGGEPLMQADFLAATLPLLRGLHVLLDTSGYAPEVQLRRIAPQCDLVYYDLKLANTALHRLYTGCDNAAILRNLTVLDKCGVPFVARVPLVPGVTDTADNLAGLARLLQGRRSLQAVHLLPYNPVAGGKYAPLGLEFSPPYDEKQAVNADIQPFAGLDVPVQVI